MAVYIAPGRTSPREDALHLMPGIYTLRYWAGPTLLAEGDVRIVA